MSSLSLNATGDVVRTDGALAVVELQDCQPTIPGMVTATDTTPFKAGNKIFRYVRRQVLTFRSDVWRANIIYGAYELGSMTVTAMRHHTATTAADVWRNRRRHSGAGAGGGSGAECDLLVGGRRRALFPAVRDFADLKFWISAGFRFTDLKAFRLASFGTFDLSPSNRAIATRRWQESDFPRRTMTKTGMKLPLALLGFLLMFALCAPLAFSQAPAPDKQELMAKVEKMSTALQLTPAQKQQIIPILKEEAPKMQAVKANTSLGPLQKAMQLKQISTDTDAKLQADPVTGTVPEITADAGAGTATDDPAARSALA